MPTNIDFTLDRQADGDVTIVLAPPSPIGGVPFQFTQYHRTPTPPISGSASGLITKSMASGFYNYVSGMDIVNSGQGIMNVRLFATDLSGDFEHGPYYWRVERMLSGLHTIAAEGFRQM